MTKKMFILKPGLGMDMGLGRYTLSNLTQSGVYIAGEKL